MPVGIKAQVEENFQVDSSIQVTQQYSGNPYIIRNFVTRAELLKNTSLQVEETIGVNFLQSRHGIYRDIRQDFQLSYRSYRTPIENISVTDDMGSPVGFSTQSMSDMLRIKIGKTDEWVSGDKKYVIKYTVKHVPQRYEGYDEVYWNVLGTGWDAPIERAEFDFKTDWAGVTKKMCVIGQLGMRFGINNCDDQASGDRVDYQSTTAILPGQDMTVTIGLNPDNQLVWPGFWEVLIDEYGKYSITLIPALLMGLLWWFKGRDLKYKADNIYYKPENDQTEAVGLFAREYLPMVYSPIKGLTPAEMGTIFDQSVDVADVVGEILELARLKFIEIKKVKGKTSLLGERDEYWFINLQKGTDGLKAHQKMLLSDITNITFSPGPSRLEEVFGGEAVAYGTKCTTIEKMKGRFSAQLESFKELLYKDLESQEIFDGRSDKIRKR